MSIIVCLWIFVPVSNDSYKLVTGLRLRFLLCIQTRIRAEPFYMNEVDLHENESGEVLPKGMYRDVRPDPWNLSLFQTSQKTITSPGSATNLLIWCREKGDPNLGHSCPKLRKPYVRLWSRTSLNYPYKELTPPPEVLGRRMITKMPFLKGRMADLLHTCIARDQRAR